MKYNKLVKNNDSKLEILTTENYLPLPRVICHRHKTQKKLIEGKPSTTKFLTLLRRILSLH